MSVVFYPLESSLCLQVFFEGNLFKFNFAHFSFRMGIPHQVWETSTNQMYVGKPEGSCEKLGLVLNFCNS
jgi:hypothetical protein